MSTRWLAAAAAIDAANPSSLDRAKARGLMRGYDVIYDGVFDNWRVDGVEVALHADLVNIETGRQSRTFEIAGKLDVRLTDPYGNLVIMDHKTASAEISDPGGAYWQHLSVESQASHYMLLEWMNGRKIKYAIWDVIRKPDIRPRELRKAEIATFAESRSYCGFPVPIGAADAALAAGRENEVLYELRLAHDCIVERPDRYFAQKKVHRLNHEIAEYASELWEQAEEIRIAQAAGRHPRSSKSCMRWNYPCRYLGICSGYDVETSDKWRRKTWMHPELPIIESAGAGESILTNSRIQTFQSCRREHHYTYGLGMERVDEDREALVFGNLMHEALAAWWVEQGRMNDTRRSETDRR